MSQRASRRDARHVPRQLAAFQLRRDGLNYRQIGAQLGISYQAAHKLVTKYMETLRTDLDELVADVRRMELERLDAIYARLWQDLQLDQEGGPLEATGQPGTNTAVPSELPQRRIPLSSNDVSALLRVMQRRAKLLGLDAPEKIEASGPGGKPLGSQELDLSRLSLDELRQLNALLESARPQPDDSQPSTNGSNGNGSNGHHPVLPPLRPCLPPRDSL